MSNREAMVDSSVEKIRIRGVGPLLFTMRVMRVWQMPFSFMACDISVVSISGARPPATTFVSLDI